LGEPRELARRRATNASRAGDGTGPPPPPRGLPRAELASSVALLLAFVAVVLTGMLWWQYRQFYVSLDQTDAAAAESLTRVRAEQRALQDRLADTGDELAALTQSSATLGERLDTVPARFADLEARLDAVQGGSFDARGELLRTEAEYYLVVANTELTLTRDFATALTALELADGRLAELGDPQLAPVREKVAGELLALRSMRLPDIEGIVFSLGRLAGVPMRCRCAPTCRRISGSRPTPASKPSRGSADSGSRSKARCSISCASSGATTPCRKRCRPPSACLRAVSFSSSSSSRALRRCAPTATRS
jgi:hypothetical protein